MKPPFKPTPYMEQLFQLSMARYSREENESAELVNCLAPLLHNRCERRKGLVVLELGPRGTTIVPRTMQGHFAQYVGLDNSGACVSKQQENLRSDGVADAYAVQGNTYCLPFVDNTQDLVVAADHDPLFAGTEAAIRLAFSEVSRVLKTGGELILLPWVPAGNFRPATPAMMEPGKCYCSTHEYIASMPFEFFNQVERRKSSATYSVPQRMLLVLSKP